jgi:FixJ family two-component response regulator
MTETGLSIAVVDDEESVRVALRRLCVAYGMDAETFASVEQLFDSLEGRRFDCLVLDAHMPGYGGLDAQTWLHESGIRIPAVIITGRDDDEMRIRSREVGATACLCKPIDAEILFGAIRLAVRNSPNHGPIRWGQDLRRPWESRDVEAPSADAPNATRSRHRGPAPGFP